MKKNFNPTISEEQIDAIQSRLLEKLSWMDGFPHDPGHLRHACRAWAKFVQNRQHEREDLGSVNDLDWLIEQIADRYERFPMPIKARELYEDFFTPADGRYSTNMGTEQVPE